MSGLRGFAIGALGLFGLEAILSSSHGTATTTGLFSSAAAAVDRVLNPSVPLFGSSTPATATDSFLASLSTAGTAAAATSAPGATSGAEALPLPAQYMTGGTVDQGVDYTAPANTPEYAIGPGTIVSKGISGFGPDAPVLAIDSGPLAGQEVYYGHSGPSLPVGSKVTAGQEVATVGAGIVGISTGPHLEIGFYPPGGAGAGASMKQFLDGLAAGPSDQPQSIGAFV